MGAVVATISTSPRRSAGPDRITIYLLSLGAFLAVLALMAWQLRSAPTPPARPVVVLRRVYQTRVVVETVIGAAKGSGGVTQSVSSSGAAVPVASAPATRAS
jgi:hypothetical protein